MGLGRTRVSAHHSGRDFHSLRVGVRPEAGVEAGGAAGPSRPKQPRGKWRWGPSLVIPDRERTPTHETGLGFKREDCTHGCTRDPYILTWPLSRGNVAGPEVGNGSAEEES